MNRDRAKELLPIITAFSEGKSVQFKSNKWITAENINFDTPFEYRIKPEPREVVLIRNISLTGTSIVARWFEPNCYYDKNKFEKAIFKEMLND